MHWYFIVPLALSVIPIGFSAYLAYGFFAEAWFSIRYDNNRNLLTLLFAGAAFLAVTASGVGLMYDAYHRHRTTYHAAQQPRTVYVCTGPAATRYHLTDTCWALRQCSADIVSIPLDSAAEYGYTSICRLCRKYEK